MYRIESVLRDASRNFESVRDAMAAISAFTTTGSPSQLTAAASALERSVAEANGSSKAIRRLIRRLGAENMAEAAARLCDSGRPDAARGMMRLHALASDMMKAQTGIDTFIGECLQSIRTARGFMGGDAARGGRLLGSA